jgi:hypothetical protein
VVAESSEDRFWSSLIIGVSPSPLVVVSSWPFSRVQAVPYISVRSSGW